MSNDVSDPHSQLVVIERRIIWLEKRIAQREAQGLDASHDRTEVNALKWAVDEIGECTEQGKRNEQGKSN